MESHNVTFCDWFLSLSMYFQGPPDCRSRNVSSLGLKNIPLYGYIILIFHHLPLPPLEGMMMLGWLILCVNLRGPPGVRLNIVSEGLPWWSRHFYLPSSPGGVKVWSPVGKLGSHKCTAQSIELPTPLFLAVTVRVFPGELSIGRWVQESKPLNQCGVAGR